MTLELLADVSELKRRHNIDEMSKDPAFLVAVEIKLTRMIREGHKNVPALFAINTFNTKDKYATSRGPRARQ